MALRYALLSIEEACTFVTLRRFQSVFLQPSAALRAGENADQTAASIAADLVLSLLFPIEETLHQLSELKQTLTDLRRPWRMMREPHFPLKKDSAATFGRRMDAVLLAGNSAGNQIPFSTRPPLL